MKINQLAARLEIAVTEIQARAILNEYLKSFGIHSYAFTYYSGHIKTGRKLHYHCVSEALKPWHNHYLEQGYADVDRTLEESHTNSLPLFWDVQDQLLHAKNTRELRIREESIEFKIDKGISIPVHGPNNDFASLTLHQRLDETCLTHYEIHQYEWISATRLFYHHIKRLLNLSNVPTHYKLTRREEQCLILTSKSWRVEQIAKELKISPRTVNFHIQNANKKLGTNNKYQATYKYFQFIDR